MVESQSIPAADSVTDDNSNPTKEDITAMIAELEQYRARLVEDFTNTAKKAKLPKSMTMAQLKNHPEILKIDTALAQLKGEASPAESEAVGTTES